MSPLFFHSKQMRVLPKPTPIVANQWQATIESGIAWDLYLCRVQDTQISAIIITHQNEETIAQVLESVIPFVSEVIVVDDYSTDGTVQICKEKGAQVILHPFRTYPEQKQYGVNQATFSWVWVIDSDEVVTPTLGQQVKKRVGKESGIMGYYVANQLVFMGKPMKRGPEAKQYNLRIFHRDHGQFNHAILHEKVLVNGKTDYLKGTTLHYSFRDINHYIQKHLKYADLYAESRKKSVSFCLLMSKPIWEFFRNYVIRGLWMEGKNGLIWATLCAWYNYIKLLKKYEQQGK